MKQYSIKELYRNLSVALKELPFEITNHNVPIAVVQKIGETNGSNVKKEQIPNLAMNDAMTSFISSSHKCEWEMKCDSLKTELVEHYWVPNNEIGELKDTGPHWLCKIHASNQKRRKEGWT